MVFVANVWFGSCAASNSAEEGKMGQYGDFIEGPPISEISFRASGGRSPVEEFGITVKEYSKKIIIRSFKIWRRDENSFDKESELSKDEYQNLWKEIEKYDVWSLENSFEAEYTDAFTYEFTFSRDKKIKKIQAYGLSEPKLEQIIRFLNQLAS